MVVMTTVTVNAIGPDAVRELLTSDDAGNPARPFTATEESGPLRCCLRPMRAGERVALVSYAPLRRWAAETGAEPGPYSEVGPVFIHAGGCDGPAGSGYPAPLAGGRRVLRAYSAAGTILSGTLFEPGPSADPAAGEAALTEIFADPEVALVHTRALEFGCFIFEARRAG